MALPLRFILTGLAALFAGTIFLVARPIILAGYHYSAEVLAATHLFVLGWICSVIMGAMYHLVPVALETRLHSERLARWQFVLHVIGFMGMVLTFQFSDLKHVEYFGLIVAIGVGLFVYNLARTLVRIPRWNVVAAGIAASLFWLSLASIWPRQRLCLKSIPSIPSPPCTRTPISAGWASLS
jgi:cbb3-type cytochrome oxidase subunit 1